MNYFSSDQDELQGLLIDLFDGSLTSQQQEQLGRILQDDPAARQRYLLHMAIHGRLCKKQIAASVSAETVNCGSPTLRGWKALGQSPPPRGLAPSPRASGGFFAAGYRFTAGRFSQEVTLSYIIATIIVGVMLAICSQVAVTHYSQLATRPLPPDSNSFAFQGQQAKFVGRITGMVGCRWAEPSKESFINGARVPVGKKLTLASGLAQITYDNGANVILQGPCSYMVDSARGGYLALGKLTARVEQRGKGQGPVAANPASPHPRIPASPNPPSTRLQPSASLFTVRTPTALITDLGTEFGVEVGADGKTISHVFQGSVRVQAVAADDGRKNAVVLQKNESAVVEIAPNGPRLVLAESGVNPPSFARRLVEPPKQLDLLDVVAGGYGAGLRRERGIDPSSGKEDPNFIAQERRGDGKYHLVKWHKLIDGVFVPGGGRGPVALDSAGHAFDGFPVTSGITWGSIWPRTAEVKPDLRMEDPEYWIFAMGHSPQFAPEGRGLLGMHANMGITFDLEAMRKVHPGARPARFQAVIGLGDAQSVFPTHPFFGMADAWVFVDGKLKYKRTQFRALDGSVKADVELGPNDHFLTLVSTDDTGDNTCDWVVFGDPVLQMAAMESDDQQTTAEKGGASISGP